MEKIRKRMVFQGRVQGVGFRWHARHAALALGLTGWVKNEYDGSVTMEIQGSEAGIRITGYVTPCSAISRRAFFTVRPSQRATLGRSLGPTTRKATSSTRISSANPILNMPPPP